MGLALVGACGQSLGWSQFGRLVCIIFVSCVQLAHLVPLVAAGFLGPRQHHHTCLVAVGPHVVMQGGQAARPGVWAEGLGIGRAAGHGTRPGPG